MLEAWLQQMANKIGELSSVGGKITIPLSSDVSAGKLVFNTSAGFISEEEFTPTKEFVQRAALQSVGTMRLAFVNSDKSFILLYLDSANSGYLTMRSGQIRPDGSTYLGYPYVLVSSGLAADKFDVCMLDESKGSFLLYYLDATPNAKVRGGVCARGEIAILTGETTISMPEGTLSGIGESNRRCERISTGVGVISFTTLNSSTYKGWVKAISYDGAATISQGATPYQIGNTINSGMPPLGYVSFSQVTDGKLFMAFQAGSYSSGAYYEGKGLLITNTGTVLTLGAEATFRTSSSNNLCGPLSALALSMTNGVVGFSDGADGSKGKAIYAAFNGTTLSFPVAAITVYPGNVSGGEHPVHKG